MKYIKDCSGGGCVCVCACVPLMSTLGSRLVDMDLCLKINNREFPGGVVVKTPYFQFRGPGFDPWSGN